MTTIDDLIKKWEKRKKDGISCQRRFKKEKAIELLIWSGSATIHADEFLTDLRSLRKSSRGKKGGKR